MTLALLSQAQVDALVVSVLALAVAIAGVIWGDRTLDRLNGHRQLRKARGRLDEERMQNLRAYSSGGSRSALDSMGAEAEELFR